MTKKKLRIAMLGGSFIRIPPDPAEEYVPIGASGAPEIIVHNTTEELVRRGHQVTLFAAGESKTSARLVSVREKATLMSVGHGPHSAYEMALVSEAYRQAAKGEFDIIHSHYETESAHFAPLVATPTIQTLHPPISGHIKTILSYYKNTQYYASISNNQRKDLPDLQYVTTAYNGLDFSAIPFSEKKEDYLIHVGRVTPEKGTALAIQIAKAAKHRLFLFGALPHAGDYWTKNVEPEVDDKQIVYRGQVSRPVLFDYLSRAKAFIFPIQWEEPFGLVLIEAMACGTPIIALRRGAVPEVVVDGKTGFIVDSLEEMEAALAKVGTIDPQACRDHVEKNFSIEKMVDSYEQAYSDILDKQRSA
jgi:glycosyltransferase involved in cell wall biosynthesis